MNEFTEKILNGRTFLINLDVATDRLETALRNIEDAGFTRIERVSGVHASEISAEDLAAEWARHGSPKFCEDEVKGSKFQAQIGRQGCMLSHLNVWKKIIESDGPDGELFTVFEDDVIFHSQ